MRVILVLALTTAALAGCGKKKPPPVTADGGTPAGSAAPAGGTTETAGGSTTPPKSVTSVGGAGGVVAGNQNGNLTVTGGQGAVQSTRTAAARLANQVQLDQLQKSMAQTYLIDNRVPSADEVMKEAQQNPQLFPLLKDEVIVLTGTTQGEGVWAYSQYPQRMGEHYVVTRQGVGQMAAEDLRKRLEQQQSVVKLAK